MLIQLLHEESRLTTLQIRMVSERKLCRLQRRSYRQLQAKIFSLWDQYENGQRSAKMATKFLNPLILLVLAIFYVQKPHHFSENTRESSNLNLVVTLGRKSSLHLGYEAFYQRVNSKISLNSSTSSNSGLLFLSILLLSGDIQPNPRDIHVGLVLNQ